VKPLTTKIHADLRVRFTSTFVIIVRKNMFYVDLIFNCCTQIMTLVMKRISSGTFC